MGIPITQLCDRKNNIAKSQDGFIEFLVKPLFEGFGKFLTKSVNPELAKKYHEVCLGQLAKNKEYWEQMIKLGDQGSLDFLTETEPYVRNIKLPPSMIESLLNFPEFLEREY